MRKIILILFIIFGLLSLTENSSADEYYKWVDAKGTTHFSDNPTSGFLSSGYKETILIKDGSVQSLKKLSFGERALPEDQLLLYYKSEGRAQTRARAEERVSPSRQVTRQAISSSFSPFTSPQQGSTSSSGAATSRSQTRKLPYRHPVDRRPVKK